MNNQSNNDYDKNLSWSENPDDIPSWKNENNDENNTNVNAEFSSNTNADAFSDADKYDDSDVDKRKTVIIGLIKAASMAVLALALLIFVGIAWFTMSSSVKTDGTEVKVATLPFELAASGSQVRHRSMFSKLDLSNLGYSSGTVTTIDGATLFATGVDTDRIFVRFDGTENDAKKELEPGGSGIVEFYVIPNRDGDLSIDFNLNIKGYYAQINDETKQVTKLWDISTLTTDSGLTASEVTDKKDALNFLMGHIFFFGKEGNPDAASNPHYYEEPIESTVYHIDIPNAEKGEAYPVRIYWMWPRTLGQITLDYDTASLRSGIPIVKDGTAQTPSADKNAILRIVKNKKASIFKTTSTITDAMIDDSADYFSVLSRGYNEADQMIGTNVDYYLLEISAIQAGQSPSGSN